jgi:YidC/Oxa1 family membrane protein insertase
LHAVGLGWGLAIVVLTLIVRLSLLPLTLRQTRAQTKLTAHLPELTRLRKRHGRDPERLKAEMTAYYREHDLNPLAPFLPILIQIPIFLSLYFLMRYDVASGLFSHAGFLFIPDLTEKPHGLVLGLLICCYVGSQLAASLLIARKLEGRQRKLILALPLVFVAVAARFPAGLLLYWITSSVWTLGQQVALNTLGARRNAPRPERASAPPSSSAPAKRAHSRSKRKQRRRRRRGH